MGRAVKLVKDPENEIPVEIMEKAIEDVAHGFRKLDASRLSRRAIVVLLHDAIGTTVISKRQIGMVLDAASNLEVHFLKKKA